MDSEPDDSSAPRLRASAPPFVQGSYSHCTKEVQHNKGVPRHHKIQRKSANHLLNFSLPERVQLELSPRKKKKTPNYRKREDFLQANFRFVISSTKDFLPAMYDPDVMVEWDIVEQVLLRSYSDYTCPICLDTPQVPKITRCGHIYCWPCILRYLSYSDRYWRRCPMCFDSVSREHLRSVHVEQASEIPSIGNTVTFRLLRRNHGDIFPHLVSNSANAKSVVQVPFVTDQEAIFSRILLASLDYTTSILDQEIKDLNNIAEEIKDSDDSDMLPFVQEAVMLCEEKLKKYSQQPRRGSGENRRPRSNSGTTPEPNPFFFYQLGDGQYVFLHPINLRCLTKEHDADTSLLPLEITGKVIDVDQMPMTPETRNRFRFLQNLPLYCEIFFCEIDLGDQVSPKTLNSMRHEIKKREKQRKRKQELELESKREVETEDMDSVEELSFVGNDEVFPSLETPTIDVDLVSLTIADTPDLALVNSQTGGANNAVRSFAEITRKHGYFPSLGDATTGAVATGAPSWPSISDASKVVNDEVAPLGAWGKPCVTKSSSAPSNKGPGKKGKQRALFSNTQRRAYQ